MNSSLLSFLGPKRLALAHQVRSKAVHFLSLVHHLRQQAARCHFDGLAWKSIWQILWLLPLLALSLMSLPADLSTAEETGGPAKAYFHFEDQCCVAVVVRAVDTGALVCIPRGGIHTSVFEAAATRGYTEVLGPCLEGAVQPVIPGSNRVSKRFLEVFSTWMLRASICWQLLLQMALPWTRSLCLGGTVA